VRDRPSSIGRGVTVVVIGGGIVGLAGAYHLLRLGERVIVLDAAEPGGGASHGNAGWIVPADSGPVPAPGMVVQGLKWMLRKDSPLYVRPSLDPQLARFMLTMARRCTSGAFRSGLRATIELGERTFDLLDGYAADGMAFEMHAAGLLIAFASGSQFRLHCADLDIPAALGLEPQLLSCRTPSPVRSSSRTSVTSGRTRWWPPCCRGSLPSAARSSATVRCSGCCATVRVSGPWTPRPAWSRRTAFCWRRGR
jgi:hypothetical protein